jgi:hypothetical protein
VSPVHPGSGQAARTATAERTHCVPLLEAASIDLYKRNGFRITGLASDATAKQVSKRGDKLKLMEELGQGVGANTNAFALNPPPSVDDIREALQRLKDPESRLIDEFFWFWPEESSESDEAIQAYLTGDGEKAFDFWHGRRGTSAPGMVAYHNLAVINHMMAIEWTTQYLDASPDAATQERISAYWSTAIRYWRRVGQNDSAWDALKERIRILDDPRLTTGLARRMRAVLPEAVASINATFALKLAERGQASATETQIKYVRDIGLDDHLREEMFLRLLKPTCERFSTQVNEVGKTEQEPKKRFASAQAVLAQVPVVSHLLETFFGLSHHRTELLDEAIVACANAATAYQKVTGDMEGFLAAAKQSLPYATSTETRERVQTNIDSGEKGLRRKAFEPFLNDLESIVSAKHSPQTKLAAIRREIMPRLATVVRDSGPHSPEAHDLQNQVAIALRDIGIDAHNEHEDFATAMEATRLASKLARDPEIQKRLVEDQKQLDKNAEGEIKRRVDLQLRGSFIFNSRDHVQINRQYVRYNQIQISVPEINGVRYGIYREFRYGAVVKGSFKIGIHSTANTLITIECKRPLASLAQAQQDYEAIMNGVFSNIIPSLAMRCARSVVSCGLRLGNSTMTAEGMTLPSNRLFGKDEIFVPYTQIRYGFNQGLLNIVKSDEEHIKRSFTIRDTWNAAIFEEILKAIQTVKSKK